jgi:hypothetical protein
MIHFMKGSLKNPMSSIVTKGFIVGVSLASVSSAHASDLAGSIETQDYYQIQSVSVEEVTKPSTSTIDTQSAGVLDSIVPMTTPRAAQVKKAVGTAADVGKLAKDLDIGNIVDAAKVAWDIVEANKPSSSITSDTANAIPKDASWETIVGWSAPQSRTYHVSMMNNLNVKVIDFNYQVAYTYGGNIGGKGQFLSGVSIVPANITVDWGFTLTAQAKVSSVTNAGTVADPIAAMEIQMQYTISSVLKTTTQSQNYYVRGDGQFQVLN